MDSKTRVHCSPPVVAVGQTVRCALTAEDRFGNAIRGAALAALGELHRMGEAGPLTRATGGGRPGDNFDNASAQHVVEFVAGPAVGHAGVVFMLANTTMAHEIVQVRVVPARDHGANATV